uniref:Uncharacterized protein n=1 Tax=Arundo donax TaxID=35708 RepID=A0A0A8ZKL0_ARUDO
MDFHRIKLAGSLKIKKRAAPTTKGKISRLSKCHGMEPDKGSTEVIVRNS